MEAMFRHGQVRGGRRAEELGYSASALYGVAPHSAFPWYLEKFVELGEIGN
jgi:hypothetical protein